MSTDTRTMDFNKSVIESIKGLLPEQATTILDAKSAVWRLENEGQAELAACAAAAAKGTVETSTATTAPPSSSGAMGPGPQ